MFIYVKRSRACPRLLKLLRVEFNAGVSKPAHTFKSRRVPGKDLFDYPLGVIPTMRIQTTGTCDASVKALQERFPLRSLESEKL